MLIGREVYKGQRARSGQPPPSSRPAPRWRHATGGRCSWECPHVCNPGVGEDVIVRFGRIATNNNGLTAPINTKVGRSFVCTWAPGVPGETAQGHARLSEGRLPPYRTWPLRLWKYGGLRWPSCLVDRGHGYVEVVSPGHRDRHGLPEGSRAPLPLCSGPDSPRLEHLSAIFQNNIKETRKSAKRSNK